MFYDIKPVINWEFINITLSLIILVVWGFLYFLLNTKPTTTQQPEIDFNSLLPVINFSKFIKELENSLMIDSNTFYAKIANLLKLIIQDKFNLNVQALTLEEIEKLPIEEDLKDILASVYYKEFTKPINDDIEKRKKYINQIKVILNIR